MPFGRGIEEPRAVIHWPSDITTVMSVAGFAEVLASNTESAGQRIRLASVPGLAIFKLVAWSDRGTTTDKDAVGFSRLLSTYEHVVGPDDLYVAHLAAREENDFEPDATAAWLPGAHMRASKTTADAPNFFRPRRRARYRSVCAGKFAIAWLLCHGVRWKSKTKFTSGTSLRRRSHKPEPDSTSTDSRNTDPPASPRSEDWSTAYLLTPASPKPTSPHA